MKIEIADFIIDSYGVAKHTGLAECNVRRTYINNKKKDKEPMLIVLAMGSYCVENKISPKELQLIITNHLKVKEFHGKLN